MREYETWNGHLRKSWRRCSRGQDLCGILFVLVKQEIRLGDCSLVRRIDEQFKMLFPAIFWPCSATETIVPKKAARLTLKAQWFPSRWYATWFCKQFLNSQHFCQNIWPTWYESSSAWTCWNLGWLVCAALHQISETHLNDCHRVNRPSIISWTWLSAQIHFHVRFLLQ